MKEGLDLIKNINIDYENIIRKDMELNSKINQFKEGDFVIYDKEFSNELGRIKSFCDNPDYVFVVYKCANNWDDYKNYTGVRTRIDELEKRS